MKKLILSLFILCSILSNAQISIPQVTGLPAALNSKVDKVTGKSLISDTLSAKIQPVYLKTTNVDNTSDANKPISTATQTALNAKEPLLPSIPSNPESRFLNGNKQWAEIVLGSGGYASNVYFTNLTSTIVGTYKQTSGTHELTETIASGTCNNNEVLIHTYLFEQPVGITTVDAGVWRFTMNCAITSNVGDSKFRIVQFRRSSTGVETDMFTIYSNTIENTDYQNFIIETVQPSFLVDSLDRFGCRIYATTTTTVNKTISYKVGDGFASYLNTPLALRHPQLRDPNGNPNVQHLTAAQVTKVNNTSGTNTGDETLTSIKTKLGAASAVSDGYLRYQDFALLHIPTTVTASNGLSISGQNISLQDASLTQSGALTFNDYNKFDNKEPAITKNSGFNLPLGTTPGTVLEGRTFGTAANSSTTDFIKKDTLVVIAAGQSNMAGHYSGGGDYSQNSDVLVWGGTSWVVADLNQSPFIEQDLYGTHPNNNLAFHFCKQLQESTGKVIKLITSFHTGQPISYWNPSSSAGYVDIKTKSVNSGIASVDIILWHQGEGNTGETNSSYAIQFNQLITQLRSEAFIKKNTIFICGEMADGTTYADQNGFYKHINNYVTDDYVVVAKCSDLPINGGVNDPYNIHYSGPSLVKMGRERYFSAYKQGSYKAQRNNFAFTDYQNSWDQIQILNKGAYIPSGWHIQFDAGVSANYNIIKLDTYLNYNSVGGHIFNSKIHANTASPENGFNDLNANTAIGTKGSSRLYTGTLDSTTSFIQSRDLSGNTQLNFYGSSYIFNAGSITAPSFIGSGSSLTGVQMPITLTTNGTSGAATFENGVMNVPNYAASTATIYQTQSSISGSTGGSMVCSMPLQTGSYKKVILRFNSMSGDATYTFPASFTYAPGYTLIASGNGSPDGGSLTSITLTTTGATISGASAFSRWIIIEGY